MPETLEVLLERWRGGDSKAGERVVAITYNELRRLAAYYFRREQPGNTLQPTALVNEMFLKLSSGSPVAWQNRAHFFAVAARQMRQILIDHARRRRALKRRDTQVLFEVRETHFEDVLAVDEALKNLDDLDSRAASVVELRVFGGLKDNEIAEALDISVATVKRDWTFAKAWLISALKKD